MDASGKSRFGKRHPRCPHGYTILEVVLVLAILVLLSAICTGSRHWSGYWTAAMWVDGVAVAFAVALTFLVTIIAGLVPAEAFDLRYGFEYEDEAALVRRLLSPGLVVEAVEMSGEDAVRREILG